MTGKEFLSRVQRAGDLPGQRDAERWSTAVVSALTHLLPDPETRRHFVSQLPGFLKSHVLGEKPRSMLMDRDAFLQHVGAALGVHAPEADRAFRAVYGVLRQTVSAGEIADLEGHVPAAIAAFLRRTA
jgi:uncharacterized protein (DUF2267 family)